MALEKTLPGNPTIIIQNIDGGGSVRGINQFHQDAKPDGLTIAAIATGTFFQYILKDKAVAYPLPEFHPFLTSPFGLLAYARTDLGLGKDPVENVKHLIANPPVYGGSGPTSSDLPAMLSFDLLGIKFTGHPDLRRILMWEGYPYFPLRKDFPLAGLPTEMSDAEINEEIKVGVISAPMAGGPFVATPGEPMSEAEPRAKDEAWNEKKEKPE
jgi:hypothetical protein